MRIRESTPKATNTRSPLCCTKCSRVSRHSRLGRSPSLQRRNVRASHIVANAASMGSTKCGGCDRPRAQAGANQTIQVRGPVIAALKQGTSPSGWHRFIGWRAAILCALSVIAAVAATVVMNRPRDGAPGAPLGRIVVAPLENRTADRRLDALGLMAADWLTEGLQRTNAAEVVPSPSVFQASRQLGRAASSSTLTPARAIAAETGATTVVTGAYYENGDSLTIHLAVADRSGTRVVAAFPAVTAHLLTPWRACKRCATA